MAAPPSAGVAVSEQERLVALIPVLTRDHFLSNLSAVLLLTGTVWG
jgi:hypothetical protein